MSRSYGQRRRDELADGGTKRNVTVVNVEGSFGLVYSAAARQRKNVNDKDGDDQAGESRCQQEARRRERRSRSEEIDTAPINGETKTYDRESGKNTDEDRYDEKKTLFAKNRAQ